MHIKTSREESPINSAQLPFKTFKLSGSLLGSLFARKQSHSTINTLFLPSTPVLCSFNYFSPELGWSKHLAPGSTSKLPSVGFDGQWKTKYLGERHWGKGIFLLCSPDPRLAQSCTGRSRHNFVQTVVSGRVSPEVLCAIKHKSAGLYSSFPSGILFNHVLNVLIYFRSMVIKRCICAMKSFTPFSAL